MRVLPPAEVPPTAPCSAADENRDLVVSQGLTTQHQGRDPGVSVTAHADQVTSSADGGVDDSLVGIGCDMHNVAPHARHLCRTPYRAQERLRPLLTILLVLLRRIPDHH